MAKQTQTLMRIKQEDCLPLADMFMKMADTKGAIDHLSSAQYVYTTTDQLQQLVIQLVGNHEPVTVEANNGQQQQRVRHYNPDTALVRACWKKDAIGHIRSLQNHNMSLTKICSEAKISSFTINRWLNHKTAGPRDRDTLDKLLAVKPPTQPVVKFGRPDKMSPLGTEVADFCAKKPLTKGAFCEMVGMQPYNMARLLRGEWIPSNEVMLKIQQVIAQG